VATFSSTQPSLRARILPRFPAQVLAGTGITITKNGGTYVFAVQAYADIPITALANIASDRLLGRDSNGVGAVEILTASGGIGFNGAGSLELTPNQRIRAVPVVFNSVSVGAKQDILVPFACTITKVTMMADVIGSVVVDIWKSTFSSYPPVVANTIVASAKPTIAAAIKVQDSTLTGWNTSILAGDTLRFNIDSFTTIARLTVSLDVVTL
jgi:hypothetical protein